jgi:predicted AAA+ superfamily ATPase
MKCELSREKVSSWINILQASYMMFSLPAFHNNFESHLVRRPKLYFYDTGLGAFLLELDNINNLEQSSFRGALFENLVILELLKGRMNLGLPSRLYFWQDKDGYEIDCIANWGEHPIAIEIKCSERLRPEMLDNLKKFQTIMPNAKCYLVYLGESRIVEGINLIGLDGINEILNL